MVSDDVMRRYLAMDLVYEHEAAHAVLAWLLFGDVGETVVDQGGGSGQYLGRQTRCPDRRRLGGERGYYPGEIPRWILTVIVDLAGLAAENVRLQYEGLAPSFFTEPMSSDIARDELVDAEDPELVEDRTRALQRCRCVAWASGRRATNCGAIAKIYNACVLKAQELVEREDVWAGVTAMAARLRATRCVGREEMEDLLAPLIVPLDGPFEDRVRALDLHRALVVDRARHVVPPLRMAADDEPITGCSRAHPLATLAVRLPLQDSSGMSKALAFSASAIPAVIRLIADKAPATTLAELIADASIGVHARAMTLGQLANALASAGVSGVAAVATRGPAAKATKGSKGTKRGAGGSRAERAARSKDYDAAVLAEISAASEPVGAVAVRGKVGGDADEFRASVERLIASKKVKKSGIAKGTRYRVA